MYNKIEDLVNTSYNSKPKYPEKMSGFPSNYKDIQTLGDLLKINYKIIPAKEQLAKNLIKHIKNNEIKYPGILGFDDDIIPALDRAILSLHDIFLVGKIGQAKTRIVEVIAKNLLSPIPVIQESLTNDCPMDLPSNYLIDLLLDKDTIYKSNRFYIGPESAKSIQENKLDTPIYWKNGEERYQYVLATPDITVKDLIGYVDPIKVAKSGVAMNTIESYSPGKLMLAKHGIFCIDELPVLDPRKQVALLSVLQEGIFTTGSYPIIFEPKTVFFATANPIDYTHSGKIIEPLYDRLKSHIHTRYPKNIEDEMLIIIQESKISDCFVSVVILKILAKIIENTRTNLGIEQDRGISVRLGIHGLELLVGESKRARALVHDIIPTPRITDLTCLTQIAKFELSEMDNTHQNRTKLFENIINESIRDILHEFVNKLDSEKINRIKQEFKENDFYASQEIVWKNDTDTYESQLQQFPTLKKIVNSQLVILKNKQEIFNEKLEEINLKLKYNTTHIFDDELKSLTLELILEYLCHIDPPLLMKKENKYVKF